MIVGLPMRGLAPQGHPKSRGRNTNMQALPGTYSNGKMRRQSVAA